MKSSNYISTRNTPFSKELQRGNFNHDFKWKVRLNYIQGLTPKFPRSFVSREQLNSGGYKNGL